MRVHDNYIHHNQQYRRGLRGSRDEGAYALIEKNVFDYNRHAIKSAGDPGTGYYAHRNLVLAHGGLNYGGRSINTHQFDVHGTRSCSPGEVLRRRRREV